MWTQRFALALALLIETGDGEKADLLLKAKVMAVCRKLRMADDCFDVLQNTWIAIIALMRNYATSPSIANQTPNIIRNQAVNLIRKRASTRKLDMLWSRQTPDDSLAPEEPNVDEELAILLAQLRLENPRQHDAIALVLRSVNHEEARTQWQRLHQVRITPANFRQLCHRGTVRLRRYWEQSDD